MHSRYFVLSIFITANGSAFAFMQPISMIIPRRITSLRASGAPEGPESELFEFLKSIVEKPIDWNINEPGKSPFGFDSNAELWNGRIAQVSFVWIFLQEWVQGKGVFQSITEGDLVSNISLEVVCLMLLFVSFQFCMLPFEQNVKIQVPREWLENQPLPPIRSQPPERKEPKKFSKSDGKRWNLNGANKAPYGFDVNAEAWNGRVAMICFAWVFLQEWIQDKGLLTGLEEKHGPSEAAFLLFVIGLSCFITYLHNMFSLEAEAYRKSRIPPEPEREAPKVSNIVAAKSFQFGQTNGDIRASNGESYLPGTLRPSTSPDNVPRQPVNGREWSVNGSYPQNRPPDFFRQQIRPVALPPRPNIAPVNSRQPMSPDGRLPPSFNPPTPILHPPPPRFNRPNSQPAISDQTVSSRTRPNNSPQPNLQQGSFGQAMSTGTLSSGGSIRSDLRPVSFRQTPDPGVVPSNNAYPPMLQQGQGLPAGGPANTGPIAGPDEISYAPQAVPFERSMIQSYEESLRTMTKETSRVPPASNQQELRYEAPTYPEPPRVTPSASEPVAPPRTQLFRSDALSFAAKGDPSLLDQIAPTFSTGPRTEIVPPETKPGVRPFPKPESFSFSPDTPIAQLGKSSLEQSRPAMQRSREDESTYASFQPEDTSTASPDPWPYSPEPPQPRYQSSPYNMPDPTKRRSYLDQLGPS